MSEMDLFALFQRDEIDPQRELLFGERKDEGLFPLERGFGLEVLGGLGGGVVSEETID